MNNVLFELVGLSILCGMLLFYSAGLIVEGAYLLINRNKFPGLESYKDEDVCTYHKWDNMTLAIRGLDTKSYTVCVVCGLVSGTTKKLNKPGLEVYRNNLRLRYDNKKLSEKVMRTRQEKLDKVMNKLISNVISTNSDRLMIESIDALQQFFRKSVFEVDQINADTVKEYEESKR